MFLFFWFFFTSMLFLPKIPFCVQPPDEMQPCWPIQSLWSLIAEQVPGSELPKIRGALGSSLVDMYVDLYAEVRAQRRFSIRNSNMSTAYVKRR